MTPRTPSGDWPSVSEDRYDWLLNEAPSAVVWVTVCPPLTCQMLETRTLPPPWLHRVRISLPW